MATTSSQSDYKTTIIDGKAIAQTIRTKISNEVRHLSHSQIYGKVPGLVVVVVRSKKDSHSYVSMKRKACAEVGIKSFDLDLPEDVSQDNVISKLSSLNLTVSIAKAYKLVTEISIEKDVDAFHPLNILAMKGRDPLFLPCNPNAIH